MPRTGFLDPLNKLRKVKKNDRLGLKLGYVRWIFQEEGGLLKGRPPYKYFCNLEFGFWAVVGIDFRWSGSGVIGYNRFS